LAISTLLASASGMLGAERLGPAPVSQHRALGDAHAGLVRLEIGRLHELHRMRGHHRQLQLGGKPQRALHVGLNLRRGLALAAGALQFDIKALRKQPLPLRRCLLRTFRIVHQQRLADVAEMRAGQGDQAVAAALFEPRAFDLGVAAVLVATIGIGQQFAQAQITLVVLAQQQQARRLVAVGGVADPHVAADDGLDPGAARRSVELDHAEQVAEVGQRQRRHAVRDRARDGIVDAHDAVGDGVLAVQAEVDKGGVGHDIML
jgi:hypothetical protein